MTIRYRVPVEVRNAIEGCDRLGFDSIREAAEAILMHDDWLERWDLESWPSSARVVGEWRRGTLEQNEVRS